MNSHDRQTSLAVISRQTLFAFSKTETTKCLTIFCFGQRSNFARLGIPDGIIIPSSPQLPRFAHQRTRVIYLSPVALQKHTSDDPSLKASSVFKGPMVIDTLSQESRLDATKAAVPSTNSWCLGAGRGTKQQVVIRFLRMQRDRPVIPVRAAAGAGQLDRQGSRLPLFVWAPARSPRFLRIPPGASGSTQRTRKCFTPLVYRSKRQFATSLSRLADDCPSEQVALQAVKVKKRGSEQLFQTSK